MNDPDVNRYSETNVSPCHRFAASGNCSGCQNEHHPNLNPALVGMVAPQQYRVPNQAGIACEPCVQGLRECDKLSRNPTDDRDPCSECRNFGGEKVECRLATKMSYNDTVYRVMLGRGGSYEYKLPPFITARSKGPMPAERVKADWQGQSAEALMAKGDFLPPGVRDCPRAFTVPARESTQRAKSRKYLAKEAQRLSQFSSQPSQPWQGYSQPVPQSSFGPFQPAMWSLPPPPVVPSGYPVPGHVAPMIWSYQPTVWAPQYSNGYQAPYPQGHYPQAPHPQVPYPQVLYPQAPYPMQMPAPLPQHPFSTYSAPPPPPSPVNPNRGPPFTQAPSSSTKRPVPSADDKQASKKKRFGYDGIFSSDVLEKEAMPGPMDEHNPFEQGRA